MTPTEIRNTVRTLQAQGHSLREISRILALSRNTVRRILRQPDRTVDRSGALRRGDAGQVEGRLRAGPRQRGPRPGIAGRRRSRRALQHLDPLGQGGWRCAAPPRRAGEYDFAPGQEMQHDTSPHRVVFAKAGTAGKIVTVQCAGLVLAYSRRLFIQYYPRFTRFEAKTFLLEAARFMDGVCPVCVIDNTSVLLAAGAGADAVIAPEMLAFARTLGFRFRAHRVGHPDRKGRIERPFAYIENNFLAARTFEDFDDLNRQARRLVPRRRQSANPSRRSACRPKPPMSSRSLIFSRCPMRCRRFTSCSNASSICTAMSRSTPTATPSPSASSANRSPSTSFPPRSMSAARTPRSPFTSG